MEQKFTNIQTAFNFLSALVLRHHSKWRANKDEHGKGDNAHPSFRSKSNINNERNMLTYHEIIDRIA